MRKEKAPDESRGDTKTLILNHSTFTNQLKSIFVSSAVYSPQDLDKVENAKIEFLLEELIPMRHITIFTGRPGEGKSSLIYALVSAIATGSNFIGRKTRKTPVVFFDDENPESTLKEFKDRAKIAGEVHFVKMPPSSTAILDECESCKYTCKKTPYEVAIALYGGDVVFIFDSRAQFEKEDENSGKTKILNDFFRNLRDKGATIILIHHAGKAEGNTTLGHTNIKAGIDNHLFLEAPKKGQKYYTLHRGKNRYFSPEETFFIAVDFDHLSYSDETQTVKDGSLARIARAISDCGHPNQGGIVKTVKTVYPKWGDNSIRKSLKEGIGYGYWTEEVAYKNNESFYKLTADGSKLLLIGTITGNSHKTITPEIIYRENSELSLIPCHKTGGVVLWGKDICTGDATTCDHSVFADDNAYCEYKDGN